MIMRELIADYCRLMRIPGIVGLAMTPVVGALTVSEISLSVLAPLFLIGVISKIYGFVMNDYFDVEVDSLSPDLSQRALVKGTISRNTAKYIVISCWFLGYLVVFVFFFRLHLLFYIGLLCMIISDILGIIYNRYGKKLIGSDFLIALSESLFLFFGACMVLRDGVPGGLTWFVFLFLFAEQWYMNAIAGALKDIDHDAQLNTKNIALALGVHVDQQSHLHIPRGFQVIGSVERLCTSALVFVPFFVLHLSFFWWQIPLFIVLVVLLVSVHAKMVSLPVFHRQTIKKYIAAQLMIWHFFVPIILLTIIGYWYVLALLFLPLLWYVLLSLLIKQRFLESQM